jgi:DNA-binding transcriptional regulator LsrR (DeoR family)
MLTSDEISCQGDKIRRHGACSLHLDAIAARAGVCRTTVQNALRQARAVRLVTLEYGAHEHVGGCGRDVACQQGFNTALSGDAVEVTMNSRKRNSCQMNSPI